MIFSVSFPDLVRLTWRKNLCDLISGQARSWGKGERLGGRGKDFSAHYLGQESFRIHQEATCYKPKGFGSAATCYWQGSDHQPLLKAANMDSSIPVLKSSEVHFLPPGAAAFSRERDNSSQHSKNLLTGLIKQREQQQALVAASSALQEYRTWVFSPVNASLLPLHPPTACL